ncbi:MAG: TonB-dependent receptor plug domain-containing protein [Bacteroidetes bacterium]|nr:TonB-dependent receptor plug domain-containing protein [Bacteroidota bacterium]
MQKIILSISFIFILNFFSFSQKLTLSGYIIDQNSGEYLIGATIYDTTKHIGHVTNKFGFYSIVLTKRETYTFQYSYVGYGSLYLTVRPQSDTAVNIYLIAGINLKEVQITANKKKLENLCEISKLEIPLEQIKILPSITGEPDILKVYQLMPGIQSGSEGNNGLYVRGGTPDQNLFLLDDVPLYNVSHMGGLYSVFDPSMVKSVELYKGGFPARYGGRISSVVDVRNKDGNMYNYKGELGLSLLLSKLFIEGPIIKDKASFAFSIRRSNLDLYSSFYNWFVSNPYNSGYTFYDINLKSNYILSKNDRLFVNFYQGKDKFFYKEKENKDPVESYIYNAESELKWGNSSASLRWYHVFGGKIFNNFTLAYTKYQYKSINFSERSDETDNSVLKDEYLINSAVQDVIIKTDFEIPFVRNSLRIGGKYSKHYYIPSSVSYSQNNNFNDSDTVLNNPEQKTDLYADDISVYGEYHFDFNKMSGNIGLRAGYYLVNDKKFQSVEPRIIINYLLFSSFSVKASYCSMQQNIHLLTNSNTGLPTDLWIPSTNKIIPESSEQITLGFAHTTKKNYEISIEGYFKKLNNLIEYKEGILVFNGSLNWDEKVETGGVGKVQGIELLIQKKEGIITGWIGYTLSKNQRTFDNLNNGRDFSFKYDQRHNISVVCNWKINDRITLSGTWLYHSGNSVTLPSGKYQLANVNYSDSYIGNRTVLDDVHIYSEKNGYRMPAYHRLDLGLNYVKLKRKGSSKWTIGVYNLYNRQNAYFLFFKTSNGETKLYQKSLFPVLINLGYTIIF